MKPDLLAEFKRQYPQKGAITWILELAITELLSLSEGQPDLNSLAGSAIRTAISRERSKAKSSRPNDKHPLTVEPLP